MILKLSNIAIVINSKCSIYDDANNKNAKDFLEFFNNHIVIKFIGNEINSRLLFGY